MSDNPELPELSVEARLIDYISANLNTITRNIQQFESTAGGSFGEVTGAAGETQGAIEKLGNEISSNLIGSVKTLAFSFVGLGSAMAIYGQMQKDIEGARELQKAHIQLATAIGFDSTALRQQAIELSNQHNVQEKEIVLAQERLGNYVKEESQIKALIPAIENLAAAKGIDLAHAADIVGRSINGSAKAMGRFGIEMTGAAGSSEKIQSAIDGLNSKFKGQADALDQLIPWWEKAALAVGKYAIGIGKVFTVQTEQDRYQAAKAKVSRGLASGVTNIDEFKKETDFMAAYETEQFNAQHAAEGAKIAEMAKAQEEETEKLREEYWKLTDDGKLKLLNKEMSDEIEAHKNNEEQITLIKLRYAKERADLLASQGKKDFENSGTGVGKAINTSPAAGYQSGTNAFNVGNMMNQEQDFLKSMAPSQDDITKAENLHNMYLSFEDKMNNIHIEDLKFLKDANLAFYMSDAESYEDYIKRKEEISKKEQELDKKNVAFAMQTGEAFGNAIASGYSKGKYNIHEALKGVLTEAVNFLEKYELAAIATNTLAAIQDSGNAIYGLIIGAAEAAGITAVADAAKGAISSFAIGTRDAPGGLAYVHKDELINLPAHSQVYTKNETKQMMGDTVHFNFYGNTDSTTVDNIQSMLIDANRTGKLKRFKSIMQND